MIAALQRLRDLWQYADGPQGTEGLSALRCFGQRRTIACALDQAVKEIIRKQRCITGTDCERSRTLVTRPPEPHLHTGQRAEGIPRHVIQERTPRRTSEPFRLGSRSYIGGHELAALLQTPDSPEDEWSSRQHGCGLFPLEAHRTATGEHEAYYPASFS